MASKPRASFARALIEGLRNPASIPARYDRSKFARPASVSCVHPFVSRSWRSRKPTARSSGSLRVVTRQRRALHLPSRLTISNNRLSVTPALHHVRLIGLGSPMNYFARRTFGTLVCEVAAAPTSATTSTFTAWALRLRDDGRLDPLFDDRGLIYRATGATLQQAVEDLCGRLILRFGVEVIVDLPGRAGESREPAKS